MSLEECLAALARLGREPGGLLGLAGAEARVEAFFSATNPDARTRTPPLLLVSGPPDSGKTTLCETALARAGCEVLRFSGEGDSLPAILSAARAFAGSAGPGLVTSMTTRPGAAAAASKALFLDDCLPDSAAAAGLLDSLSHSRALVVVAMQTPGRRPAAELVARASVAVELSRPPPPAAARRLLQARSPEGAADARGAEAEAEAEALLRGDAGGSMVRALCLLESRTWGDCAASGPNPLGIDDGFMSRVATTMNAISSGAWGLQEVTLSISSEPAMAVMLAHEWRPDLCAPEARGAALRDLAAFGRLSHSLGSVTETLCAGTLMRFARSPGGGAPGGGFPACYSALSQRAAATKRAAAEEARSVAWLAGRVQVFL